MKMFKSLVLISFFLAFTTTLVHSIDSDVVTDVNGNELRSGARYYIVAASGSEILNAATPTTPGCPTGNVVLSKGIPISITPVKSNSTVILENTYVTVRFNYSYLCRIWVSLVWEIGPRGHVRNAGTEGLNRFKLTKHDGEGGSNKYQLAACPVFDCGGVCRCEPVGRVMKDGVNNLVAGGHPLTFVFVPFREPRISYKLPSM